MGPTGLGPVAATSLPTHDLFAYFTFCQQSPRNIRETTAILCFILGQDVNLTSFVLTLSILILGINDESLREKNRSINHYKLNQVAGVKWES